MNNYTSNILAVWEVSEGKSYDWYAVECQWVRNVASTFGIEDKIVAYVVATLSPFLSWKANKESALACLEAQIFGYTNKRNSAFGVNTQKVWDAFDGKREYVATGKKVSSFQQNLLGNRNVVTIDRHAVAIARYGLEAIGRKSGDVTLTTKKYVEFSTAYVESAKIVGVDPCLVQSATWQMVAKA